jgi:putative ABC transport system substrate-binding protein
VELLSELVPEARVIALLVNPNCKCRAHCSRPAGSGEHQGLQLQILKAGTESKIDAAFASFGQAHVGALVLGPDPFFNMWRDQLAALTVRYAIPTIYQWREFAKAGGLISYGSSLTAAARQVGIYIGKIVKGAKPADLPVKQPTTFELAINLKTAKALGLTVPPSILAHASEVIE